MIKTIDLSGSFSFLMDKTREGIDKKFFSENFDDTISLPGTISMARKGSPSDVRETGFLTDPYLFEGYAWYSKKVTLNDDDLDKEIYLYLERTRMTKIWVNDTFAGEYDSLNTPHRFNLSKYIDNNEFKLTIMVSNVDYPTKGGHLTSPDTQTNWNGIIGEISLRIYDKISIRNIKTFPDISDNSVTLEMETNNLFDTSVTKKISVVSVLSDINGDTDYSTPVEEYDIEFTPGAGTVSIKYNLGENAPKWSEYSPVVYRLKVAISDSCEQIETTFGLRDFSTTETAFLINGKETFLRGKHDGLIFPLTGAVPTSVDEWIRVMKISKSYGINHYRFHTCCPPDAAFVAADYLGIYMEPQLPFWGTMTAPGDEGHNDIEQKYLIEEGFRMMAEFGNHASYCMMSLGNELWGSKERIGEIMRGYKAVDKRHLYTQGSNNFQHTPVILPEDDFFVGVRFSKNRLIRGSYGMCDAPLGHIQWDAPSTRHNYDEDIYPTKTDSSSTAEGEEIEIQYGTGVKKVKAASVEEMLLPHIPVVTHEIGQFAVYPNFDEIAKYTGVLKARNFEVFRERLDEKGMLDQAKDFFYTSGKLSVRCYKEELEAAARSKYVAGYQILDIQDFSGQGTALVGILDAFMESKGHVTPKEWSGYCSDGILMAQFDSYIHTAGESFLADFAIRYYNPSKLENKKIKWALINSVSDPLNCGAACTGNDNFLDCAKTVPLSSGEITIPDGTTGLKELGSANIPIPDSSEAKVYTLVLYVEGTDMQNVYELYAYPKQCKNNLSIVSHIEQNGNLLFITTQFDEMAALIKQGKRVLFMPSEVKESLEGFYCTDFWCYPMFRDICNWMKKPVAVGTMGLLLNYEHEALKEFPTHKYSTPQWYEIVSHSRPAILDDNTEKDYRPIVQMVDNFERNHKLGILFEGKIGDGKLLVCTSKLSEIADKPEVKQFTKSILDYATSDNFEPAKYLDLDKLRNIF